MATDPKKICLFDMDGTLVNFDGQMRGDLAALMSPSETMPEDIWDEEQLWLENRKKLIKSKPGWWLNLPRFQLGWDVYDIAVEEIGFDPRILTKGPYNATAAWTEKVEWCRRELPHVAVTITEDKSTQYGRVLVDDWIPYVEPWLARRPRGIVIMPAWPWNKGFKHDRVVRYDGTNIAEVKDALLWAFNRKIQ